MTGSFDCHACGATVAALPASALRCMAGSDCTPVHADVQIGACTSCGLLQKDTGPAWQELCRGIYGHYRIYHQAGGTEQKASRAGGTQFAPRSELIAQYVSQRLELPQNGSALDIGCGNGAFLRGMMTYFPSWRLTGTDLNESFRNHIIRMGRQVSFKSEEELDRTGESFEVVSFIHCLEHIPNPAAYLARARRYINPSGVLLIEVPDAELNPFDLIVADHATHFSKKTLVRVAEAAGYQVLECGNFVIGKEITLLAYPVGTQDRAPPPDQPETDFGRRNIAWLEQTIVQAHALAASDEQLGVFGTSIAGVWIGSSLGKKIAFFVDEDEARIGRDYFGTPILAPSQVPAGATVFVCLEPRLAQAIVARHNQDGRRYVPTNAV